MWKEWCAPPSNPTIPHPKGCGDARRGGGGHIKFSKDDCISSSQRARIQTVENLSYKKLEVMQMKIKNKSKLPVSEQTIPDQSTLSFTGMVD